MNEFGTIRPMISYDKLPRPTWRVLNGLDIVNALKTAWCNSRGLLPLADLSFWTAL